MYLTLSDEQELLLASLDEVLERSLTESYLGACDREGRSPDEFFAAMAEAGFAALGLPEEYGGTPVDAVTLCLVTERVARHGFMNGYGTGMLQVRDILEFGTDEQKRDVLASHLAGQTPIALAITEPGAGSDNSAIALTAMRKDGTVVLNGVKTLISLAKESRWHLVLAKDTDATDPRSAISMYLVPADTPGISYSHLDKIGYRTAPTYEVYYDAVEIPESALVGVKGNGFRQLMRNFELERVMAAANQLGQARYAFDLGATHAATRVQFGKAIGSFQQIQMYLTDMAIAVENMSNLVYNAARMIDDEVPLKTYGAMTKRYVAREAFTVCDLSMQIHGGVGMVDGSPVARLWRDARAVRIGGGTDEVMVHIVGRQIVKDYTPAK
jgi:alkylation response protein AidB-like acyl-CoA dehydrogenase